MLYCNIHQTHHRVSSSHPTVMLIMVEILTMVAQHLDLSLKWALVQLAG
jgi:hypothetical protein